MITVVERSRFRLGSSGWCLCLLLLFWELLVPRPLGAQQLDARTIYEHASRSVLVVVAYDEHHQPKALGSAFAIDDAGVVATNLHIIDGAATVKVKRAGKEKMVPIDGVFSVNPEYDLALLGVPQEVSALPFAETRPTVGERIVAIGNPRGLESTLSDGIVSGVRQVNNGFELYQISAPISPGSSGGPVINAEGAVVGVATAAIRGGGNLNFAVPISVVDSLNRNRGQLNELPFGTSAIDRAQPSWIQPQREGPVRAVDLELQDPYYASGRTIVLKGSIYNGTQYPIRNVRLRLICYRSGVDVPIDYDDAELFAPQPTTKIPSREEWSDPSSEDEGQSVLSIRGEPIPSGLAKPISAIGCTKRATDFELRLLDYEVVR